MFAISLATALSVGAESRPRAAVAQVLGEDAVVESLEGIMGWLEEETVLEVVLLVCPLRKETRALPRSPAP